MTPVNAQLGRTVNFAYELRIEPAALPNRHHLSIYSLWFAARRPEPQRRLSITVPRNELVALYQELGHYLLTHQEP